jgi:hypothetical protein
LQVGDVGFFNRRAEARQESNVKTQAFEAMAQYAVRDIAVGVLAVCRAAGEDPHNMKLVIPVLLNDGFPRQTVAQGMDRAVRLADEIHQTFGDRALEAEAALFAAFNDDGDNTADPETYTKLANLHVLTDFERGIVKEVGDAALEDPDALTDVWREYWKVSMDAAPGMTSMEITHVIQAHGLQSLDLKNPPEPLVAAWSDSDDKSDPRRFILSWLRGELTN